LNPGSANSGAKTASTNQQVFKQSRMNDLCAPYCKDQCAKNEQEMYQKYYETARKVHEFIPSLYGPKRDLYNTNEDNGPLDVIDFLDLNTNTNNSDDKIIQEDVMSPVGATNNANSNALVSRFDQIKSTRPGVKTLFCNSAIEVNDNNGGFEEGQLINLVIPKNNIHHISSNPENDKVNKENMEDNGYLG